MASVSAAREAQPPRYREALRVVVIGGGWAGCAAAVSLARSGQRVTLFEAAPTLGGRARRVALDGLPLDNGEHLLLGAYTETLALAAAVRAPGEAPAFASAPLALRPFGTNATQRLSLVTRPGPGSLGLLAALAGAEGIGALDRARVVAWFVAQKRAGWRCDSRTTVAELLASQPPRLRDELWYPLCIAALNTPAPRASAQIFLNVLRETFGAGPDATTLVTPCAGLGDAIPEASARWLAAHEHDVRPRTRARIAAVSSDFVRVELTNDSMQADAVVIAVGPHQLAGAFTSELASGDADVRQVLARVARLEYAPITTIYLGYHAPVTLPTGLLRLEQGPGQWIFDRSDVLRRAGADAPPGVRALLSVVISASDAFASLEHGALAAIVDRQLRRLDPSLPRLMHSRVIDEKRATYVALPGLERPSAGRLAPRLYLAGDYTYADFPATLEAAVRSGRIAADALTRDYAATAAARGSIRAP
ncbi:MAG TPA: hydroxysqualene dehydroxylase HpnE [Casimicrobiaceae bacterium]|nr:hydroxysqualene dehydroxylase HpnE [Casimicrobiaceae bacterium]